MKNRSTRIITDTLKKHRTSVVVILVCILIITAFNYYLPFFSQRLIDNGFIRNDLSVIIQCASAVFILKLLSAFVTVIKQRKAFLMNIEFKTDMQTKALDHLLAVQMDYFTSQNSTSTYQCIQEDIESISALVSESTINAVTSVLSAVGGAVALFTINSRLALAVVLVAPVNIVVSNWFIKKNRICLQKTLFLKRSFSRWFGESLNGVKEIRLFDLQERKKAEMEQQLRELKDTHYKSMMLRNYSSQVQLIMTEFLKAFIYILAGLILLKGGISVGSVVAFQSYMFMVASSEATVISLLFTFFSAVPNIRRFQDFLDYPEEKSSKEHIAFSKGSIQFKKVSFSYNNEKQVLKDLDFKLPVRSKTAIVGDNGVGKTTFLNLLLRLFEPSDGEICINGKSIQALELREYRQLFSVVSQNVFLFNESIRYNICLDKDIPDELLEEIIKDVHLDDIVSQRGLDYEVGENGSHLSGGQKQKIALARAIIQNRPIVLFDEATSNLDKDTINCFRKLFSSRLRDATVLCVTHSDSLADIFDHRLLLRNGKGHLCRIR
ncbi:MAG TPA: hypothetical protein DCZ71_02385 [Ruminococcus sp.]|nr:hypothetical protein [Ruminococcus sp.]